MAGCDDRTGWSASDSSGQSVGDGLSRPASIEEPLYAEPDEWWRYDIQLVDVVGWGLEFPGLAMVCLSLDGRTPDGRAYGRFSSAEAARRLYSRIVPLRLVYA